MGEEFALSAQKKVMIGGQYTTELQSDFGRQVNWVNLLSFHLTVPTEALGLWRNGKLEAQTISVYKTSRQRIADDRQVFSNIEENNLLFSPFIFGYSHQVGKVLLFGGLRNVNEDYFTAPYTSLFTNSSCGIYPTLSANYVLANYPLSAVCLHVEYQVNDRIQVRNSLYSGKAYLPFKRGSSVFTVVPGRDGFLDMAEVFYTVNSSHYGSYNLGVVVHGGGRVGHESVPEKEAAAKAPEQYAHSQKIKTNYAVWLSAEQSVFQRDKRSVGLLGQLSLAPAGRNDCYRYLAAGCVFNGVVSSSRQDMFGVIFSYAAFVEAKESAMEITWKYSATNHLDIQPAFHIIRTGKEWYTIGMLRLVCRFG